MGLCAAMVFDCDITSDPEIVIYKVGDSSKAFLSMNQGNPDMHVIRICERDVVPCHDVR
jgi:hypothetical protein